MSGSGSRNRPQRRHPCNVRRRRRSRGRKRRPSLQVHRLAWELRSIKRYWVRIATAQPIERDWRGAVDQRSTAPRSIAFDPIQRLGLHRLHYIDGRRESLNGHRARWRQRAPNRRTLNHREDSFQHQTHGSLRHRRRQRYELCVELPRFVDGHGFARGRSWVRSWLTGDRYPLADWRSRGLRCTRNQKSRTPAGPCGRDRRGCTREKRINSWRESDGNGARHATHRGPGSRER